MSVSLCSPTRTGTQDFLAIYSMQIAYNCSCFPSNIKIWIPSIWSYLLHLRNFLAGSNLLVNLS